MEKLDGARLALLLQRPVRQGAQPAPSGLGM